MNKIRNKIIMTFLTFCGITSGGTLLYILTGGWGIPFVLTSGTLAYFIADKKYFSRHKM